MNFNAFRHAAWAADNSQCTKLKVGCVLMLQDSMFDIVSNNRPHQGNPDGWTCASHGCTLVDGKCVGTIHAEQATLMMALQKGLKTQGACMAITHTPCIQCSILIIEAGIKSIFIRDRYKEKPITFQWFENADVSVNDWNAKPITW